MATFNEAGKPTPVPWAIGFSDGSGANDDGGYTITAGDHPSVTDPLVVVSSCRDDWGVIQGICRREDAEAIVTAVNLHRLLMDELIHIDDQVKLFIGTSKTSAHRTLAKLAKRTARTLEEASRQITAVKCMPNRDSSVDE